MPRQKILRLVLGDQLNENHSWFKKVDRDVTYVLMEIRQETDYVKHHIQKVGAFFAAMRAFEQRLSQLGHRVVYVKLDDRQNRQTPQGLDRARYAENPIRQNHAPAAPQNRRRQLRRTGRHHHPDRPRRHPGNHHPPQGTDHLRLFRRQRLPAVQDGQEQSGPPP